MHNRLLEIISVGNELLTGHTLNTNAQWMSRRVTEFGGVVKRITVVRDDIDEIASSIKESLRRKPRWIIISGGLGPTYDDKTLQGLANALKLRLILNKDAVKMLRRKYSKTQDPALTPSRLKMTTMPAKAKPIENPVGHAPAVMVKQGSCTIFSLPGVPSEMEAIFAKHVLPVLKRNIGKFVRLEAELETMGVMESVLAPYLDNVVAKNPKVYIKSHPRGYSKGVSTLHINLACKSTNVKLARGYLKRAIDQMKESVRKAGGKARTI